MGTIYSVACRDCKVTRNLDKFYAMRTAMTRTEMQGISVDISERHSFRAALLASFMWEHKGHNCTVFNEHDDDLSQEMDSDALFRRDKEYWQ